MSRACSLRPSGLGAKTRTTRQRNYLAVCSQARPIPPPAAPTSLSIHPAAARVLYRGLAVVTSAHSVQLLDNVALAKNRLDLQAVAGATLEFMDGAFRGVTRRVASFTTSNSSVAFASTLTGFGLMKSGAGAGAEEDLRGSASALANASFVRLFLEAVSVSDRTLALGWTGVVNAREYHIRVRESSSPNLGGSDLKTMPFAEIASVGNAGSSIGACRGLEPRVSVAYRKNVPSQTKRSAREGAGFDWGDAGKLTGVDLLCYEVTGMASGRLYEFQIIASNNNLERSAPSSSFYYTPVDLPTASPSSSSVSVVWHEDDSATFFWPPPATVPSAPTLAYRVEVRRLGSPVWESRPEPPPQPSSYNTQLTWQEYPVAVTLQDGQLATVRGCSVLQLSDLTSYGTDGALLSYADTILFIGSEARRILSVALDPRSSGGGGGGVVSVDACFTQTLSPGQKYSIFKGYRVTGLMPGAGFAINVYAVNRAGAAYPPARAIIPPAVYDLHLVRVRSSLIALRWTMPASASFAVIHLANATLPSLYSGGRWGPGAHAVGEGTGPPVFVALDPPYQSSAASGAGYGPRTMQVDLDGAKLPWLRVHMHLRVRITCAAHEAGPYEAIGAQVSVSTARGPPHVDSISEVRLIAMTSSSFSLQWLFTPGAAIKPNTSYPAFVAVEVCTLKKCAGGAGGRGGFFPNGTGLKGLELASKFAIMNQGEAFSRLYAPFEYSGLATGADSRVGTATVSHAGGHRLEPGEESVETELVAGVQG